MRLLKIFILPLSIYFCACTEDPIITEDIIKDVITDLEEVQADGTTVITVTALLNNELDKRTVVFQTDKGSFVDSEKGNMATVTAGKIKDQLTAITKLKAPLSPGPITISAQLDIPDQKGKYVFTKTINATHSAPSSIELFANAFSVHNNFDGEIELTAILKNANNKGVSQGYRVSIDDYNASFSPINGMFRRENLFTNSDSQISAIYSPGEIDTDQYIFLIATVLDSSDHKTAVADTLKIFITQKVD